MSRKVLQSAGVCSRLLVTLSALSILALGLAGCGGGGGGGIVPNTPGGGGTGGGGLPPSGNPAKGVLRIQINIGGSGARAIPEVSFITLTVMGAGLTVPLQAYITPDQPTTTFSDVPVGEKAIIASVFSSNSGSPVGLNAMLAQVQAGNTTTAKLDVSLASPPGILNAVFSGTKDINGVPAQVLKFSDGREEYYGYDKSPPASGPANALLLGSLQAGQTVADTWNPALVVAPAQLQLGKTITQNVTEKFADGTSETQTEKLTFEGNEGVPNSTNYDSYSYASSAPAAKVRRLLQGSKVNTARLSWLVQGIGSVIELDLDPTSGAVTGVRMLSESVGTARSRIKAARRVALPARLSQHPQYAMAVQNRLGRQVGDATNSYFPLGGDLALSYLSSKATGSTVGVTVGLPFGVTGGFASGNADNAVLVRFSKALNTTDAVNIANYALESPLGTAVDLSTATVLPVPELSVLRTSSQPSVSSRTRGKSARSTAVRQATPAVVKSVLIRGPSLTLNNDFKVTVKALRNSDGTAITEDGVYNTLKGKVDQDRFPPLIVSTTADSYNLSITFSERVKLNSGYYGSSFPVESPIGTGNYSGTATLDAAGKVVTIAFPKDNPLNGPVYRVSANYINDLNGNTGSSFQNPGLISDGTVTDVAPPRVVDSSAAPDKLTLTFSERVQKSDAENRANYEVESPEGSLLNLAAATLAYDDKTQTVTITGVTFKDTFKVRVSHITDLAGNKMDWQVVQGRVNTPNFLHVSGVDAAPDHLWVTFSHSVVSSDAENPLNYLIECPPGTKVDTSAARTQYDDSSKTVVFRGVALTAGQTVKVTVKNVNPVYYSGATNMPEDGVANVGSATVPATKLRVQSCSPTTTTVKVVFSESVNATDAVDTTRYGVQSPSGNAHYINTITYNAATNTATITLQSWNPMKAGDPCTVTVRNIRNAAGTATLSVDFIQGTVTDIIPPQVVGSSAVPNKLTLTFSKRVQKADAENPANYEIESPVGSLLSLTGATLAYDDQTQTVAITGITFKDTYKVRVSNISDLVGNKMDWQVVNGYVSALPLHVVSVDAATDHLWVTFSQSVFYSDVENPLNYFIESPPGTKVDTSAAGTLYDDSSKTVVFRGITLTAGQTVKVTVKRVGNITEDGVANVGSATVPATKLRVQSGSSTTTTVTVVFSESVNATDAVDTTRYSVVSGFAHSINNVAYDTPTNTATITLQSWSLMNAGDPCTVSVRNIRNAAGTATLSVDFVKGPVGGALAQLPQPTGVRAFFGRVVDWLRDAMSFI